MASSLPCRPLRRPSFHEVPGVPAGVLESVREVTEVFQAPNIPCDVPCTVTFAGVHWGCGVEVWAVTIAAEIFGARRMFWILNTAMKRT